MSQFQEFKEFEKAGWEQRASTYVSRTQALTGSLIGSIVDHLGPVTGLTAVDLASGPGYGAAEMASRGADVIGTDFANAMVEVAAALNPDLTFQQEDAENLSFNDSSFDLALCTFGMLHFAHPEQALSEVFRVLKPGGKFTFSVWAPPEDFPMFGLLGGVVAEFGNLDVGLPPGPPAEAFSREDGARHAVENAGFDFLTFAASDFEAPLCPASEIPDWYRDISVRSQGLLDAQPPGKLAAVEQALIERFMEYETDGMVILPMPHRIVTATKPLTD